MQSLWLARSIVIAQTQCLPGCSLSTMQAAGARRLRYHLCRIILKRRMPMNRLGLLANDDGHSVRMGRSTRSLHRHPLAHRRILRSTQPGIPSAALATHRLLGADGCLMTEARRKHPQADQVMSSAMGQGHAGRLRSICIQRTMHLSPLEPPMAGARRKTSLHPIHRHSLACFPYPRRIPPTLVAVIPVEVRNHLAHPWSTKCPVMARRRSSFQRLWRVLPSLLNTLQLIAALDLPQLHNLLLARQDMILASLHDLLSTHTPVDEL
jgi:hypothetical protein